jgi:hypothetical protein
MDNKESITCRPQVGWSGGEKRRPGVEGLRHSSFPLVGAKARMRGIELLDLFNLAEV